MDKTLLLTPHWPKPIGYSQRLYLLKKNKVPSLQKKNDKSFVGLMENLGKGLLNKLKRRFNLEEIKEKVDNTKDRVKDTFKSKKEGTTKTPDAGQTPVDKNKGGGSG